MVVDEQINYTVGSKIKYLRVTHSMTQSDLGTKLGVTFQQIQKYERGINKISAGRLFAIAAIFNVDVGYFFIQSEADQFSGGFGATGGISSFAQRKSGANLYFSDESLVLVRAFESIADRKVRETVISLVQSLVNSAPCGNKSSKSAKDEKVIAEDCDSRDDESVH